MDEYKQILEDVIDEEDFDDCPVAVYAGPPIETSTGTWPPKDLTEEERVLIARVDLDDQRSSLCWLLLVKAYYDQP